MRTLSTQVRLRRLIRAFSDGLERMLAEPADRQLASSIVLRLQELAEGVRDSWDRESGFGRSEPSLERFGDQWFDEPEAGELLKTLWAEGQRLRGDELLVELTGAELDFSALLDDLQLAAKS